MHHAEPVVQQYRRIGRTFLAGAIASLAAAPCFAVTVANAGFETGNTTGWTVTTDQPAAVTVSSAGANTGGYGLVLNTATAYTADVAQTLTSLANGQYLLTAMFQNSGGQTNAYLYANCGGIVKQTSIPVGTGWNKVVVRGVQATSGQCTIGVHTVAGANQRVAMDNVAFTVDASPAYTFLQGGDISRLTWLEQLGATFYEDGVQKDAVQILANNGFNMVRLRAFNDPGNPNYSPSNQMPAGIETTADILSLAARAGAKGMKVELTLNYSDYWADGCTQDVPHEWVGMTFDQIKTALYNYTYDIVSKLKAQGTAPAMVSLGNQMQCGILLDPTQYGPVGNWPQLAQLLNAGASAVKAASPTSQVMLHIDSPYDAAWFFDGAVGAGVNFDVIGMSWYPYWEAKARHRTDDTLPELLANLNTIAAKYNRNIVIMETGVNWAPKLSTGSLGQLQNNGNVPYAQTPQGQRDYLYDLFNVCKSVDNGRCIGIQYWDPISVNQPAFWLKVNAWQSWSPWHACSQAASVVCLMTE